MLRKISLLLNALVIVLSLALFGYTFFAKAYLVEHTRAFVTEKTLAHSGKLGSDGKVVAFSFVVFAAVAYSTLSYLEGVSFLRILLKSHLGWWYPAGMALTIVGLVLEHGLHKQKDAKP